MEIIEYPHPTLRHKNKPLQRVDAQLREMVAEMFELLYTAKGVGLAANQVGLPFRLFVVNLGGERGEDKELVFINPVMRNPKAIEEAEEGCLSLPGLYSQVRRPSSVTVQAFGLDGTEVNQKVDGLLARVVQHEADHLDGVLFIDRLNQAAEMSVKEEIEEFEYRFDRRRSAGEIPADDEIARRLADIEKHYC